MITAEEFTAFALAFDDVIISAHMAHPDYRVGGRIFASLHPDGSRGVVRLSPAQQRRWLQSHPDILEPASGAWGRAGFTMVSLARVSGLVARELLLDAWQLAAAQRNYPEGARRKRAKK